MTACLFEARARAGLTRGATYARYEDGDELLVDLWNARLQELAVKLFTLCERVVNEPMDNQTTTK